MGEQLSAAFFCPQSRAPDEEYLAGLHSFLLHNTYGQFLLDEIAKLDDTWTLFASARADVRALSHGPVLVDLLRDWATSGQSGPLAAARSGIVALPLLVVLQIGQYLRYLEAHNVSHSKIVADVQNAGGLQGYCGGLPSAIAIAAARDEHEVVRNTVIVMRVVLGVGAYGEAADNTRGTGATTLALRLKYEGQGDDLVRGFPGTYVSAITDPRSISIVGPAAQLDEVYNHACNQGLQVQKMDIRGKVHNPENTDLAAELTDLCHKTPSLRLPQASELQAPVRSNKSGERLLQGSLTEEVVTTILASRCNWYNLLNEVADDLKAAGRSTNPFVVFGLNDCLPMTPFHKQRLQATKSEAHSLIKRIRQPKDHNGRPVDASFFRDSAIAVVGASCRLPGASNLEELWSMLANGVDRHEQVPLDRFDLHGSFRASQSGNFASDRKFYGNFLDDVVGFDHSFFGVNPREAANMDPQQRILMELSVEALEASGYLSKHQREAGDNVGCFIGASLVEYLDNTNAHAPTAYTSTGTIRAFLCGRLSHHYGWCGPAEVIDTACSSSLVAINRACKAIQAGECEMALAGGVNVITGFNNFFDLGKAGFLSPTGQCKPFDECADGYCRSDGAGLVVLKSLKQAISDGDEIWGVIPGVATNQGGLSSSITVPYPGAQKALYRTVIEQSGLQPDQVTYVEAHGTGTQAGDPLEMESIRSVFGSPSRSDVVHVGSIKGNIGHCETAAGVASLLKVLAMIKHGQLPPQANHRQLNPKIPPLKPDGLDISRGLSPWKVPFRAALVNSYGAAGSNSALLCCEMPLKPTPSSTDREILLPIMLSAASKKSLVDYSQTLGAYLRQESSSLDLQKISFNLNEKRQRHKYFIGKTSKSTKDLAEQLSALDSWACFEFPKTARPVVLSFSGQNNNRVALDRVFYDTYSIFKSYIDACDAEVTKLGYNSIFPAIFQTQPIDDVAILQCSIFAVQYACAQSWIDSGVAISAIVGHSLGELTALAVSGALSLSDTIKLVSARARLIETKWGSEKGAMLALHCDVEEFKKISSYVGNQSNGALEIACYNASASLVAVGTSMTIDAVEHVLKTEPSLQKIRSQRLDTSHGFHSQLVEPILAELTAVSESLCWNEPNIRLETCTAEPLKSIATYKVSEHARKPVFFSDAVRRIENSLGPCVWLEAGLDTPIIPMIRKASSKPEQHAFYALKIHNGRPPVDLIGETVCSLWNSGIAATHWSFLPLYLQQHQPLWLPPYQFERQCHWRENVDRAAEMQQLIANSAQTQVVQQQLPPPPQLVTRKETASGLPPGVSEFFINTQCVRFQTIVGGHAVRQRPLCPASMYFECITMAIQLLGKDTSTAGLEFEGLNFHNALGISSSDREVVIRLEEVGKGRSSWKFSVQSSLSTSTRPKTTHHVNGIVSLVPSPNLEVFQRLMSGSMERLESKEDTERLSAKRAYKMFALVVDYGQFFQGIRSITLDDWEAVATIKLPDGQPGREESSSWQNCDTVTIDSFIQVVGLLMNSSDAVSKKEVMVMVGLERAVISSACKMDDAAQSWRVYTKFSFTDDGLPVGDVFVFSTNGKLVATVCGCRFTKILISQLERALDAANNATTVAEPQQDNYPRVSRTLPNSQTTAGEGMVTPATTVTNTSFNPAPDANDEILRGLLSEYIGVHKSDIQSDVTFAEMGLDSLASVELVGELSSKFEVDISSEDIVMSTLDDIKRRLGLSTSVQPEATANSAVPINEKPIDADTENCRQQFLEILVEVSGAKIEDIELTCSLADLGVDSLSCIDLKQELEEKFSIRLDDMLLEYTVIELMALLKIVPSAGEPDTSQKTAQPAKTQLNSSQDGDSINFPSPFDSLKQSDSQFNDSANKQGFLNYWSEVAPFQDELLLAYITEGFRSLGVDLANIHPGSSVPQVPHLTQKYDKLVPRLWQILEKHGLVTIKPNGHIERGASPADIRPSAQLVQDLETRFPMYEHETNLIRLTGPKLADCLSGNMDPISIMFGNSASLKIMENFYGKSPMMSTLTEQLVIFLTTLLRSPGLTRPVRILEVGAGTGGTTKRLAEALKSAGIQATYTFTDISPSLVSKAKNKFKQYPWFEYSIFNVEKDVPDTFKNRFDIVVSANCVHATTDRTASCRRLREVLTPEGFIVLSEVTHVIDWYDICFGLLDGWWLAEGRTAYPLQPAEAWMSTFAAAGFSSSGYSKGLIPEANSQQLLVACRKVWDTPIPPSLSPPQDAGAYRLETMVYKEVSGLQIHADVFFPRKRPSSPLPIALMIHGGGHMTLSRKAVRPIQTQYLIANGFLPVSVDYRLCPEVNLIDGPMADVYDAYQWTRTTLPSLSAAYGCTVDVNKVVVIGWSTGGQLAMSVCWTAKMAGVQPPAAVLSFYAPVDFESGELDKNRLSTLPGRSMSMERIIASLPTTPITNYDSSKTDSTDLGWVRPGDPRSELVLSLFKEGIGLPLLLNGLPRPDKPSSQWFAIPDAHRIATISPLSHLRRGTYDVPTFIIHGTRDQIAPFAGAERFVSELQTRGIRYGFLPLPGAAHIHDLKLKPGTREWEAQVAPGYRFLFDAVQRR